MLSAGIPSITHLHSGGSEWDNFMWVLAVLKKPGFAGRPHEKKPGYYEKSRASYLPGARHLVVVPCT
jgi:hypothetical protein